MGVTVSTDGIDGTGSHHDAEVVGRMSEDTLARLRDLAMESEARWGTMRPNEAARLVYYLQRLGGFIVTRAAEAGSAPSDGYSKEQS